MRSTVMISAPYMQPVVDRFRPLFRERDIDLVVPRVRERLDEADLLELIPGIDGVICGDDRFTEKVFRKAKRLKVIAKWGTGIDSIDLAAATRRGIKVYNTPDAFTHPVADSVLGYILSFARRIPWTTEEMKSGRWQKEPCVALRECTLGIIGVGNVGRAVARRAAAFGMTILGNDIRSIPRPVLKETGMKVKSLNDVLNAADFVTLHTDLNPTSFHLIGAKELALMKPAARIINTARGPVIEEKALIGALKRKEIAGAALDVYEEEPLPRTSPLRRMSNCLLAPHNANSSPGAWEFVHENSLRNLFKGLGLEDGKKGRRKR
jgi:D-3-phosphoglycerate dehydrogenase / 2-oxoglutarate reductase